LAVPVSVSHLIAFQTAELQVVSCTTDLDEGTAVEGESVRLRIKDKMRATATLSRHVIVWGGLAETIASVTFLRDKCTGSCVIWATGRTLANSAVYWLHDPSSLTFETFKSKYTCRLFSIESPFLYLSTKVLHSDAEVTEAPTGKGVDNRVGNRVGAPVGNTEGFVLGVNVGGVVWDAVGMVDGQVFSWSEGMAEGMWVGHIEDTVVGTALGGAEGVLEGIEVGNEEGSLVGVAVAETVGVFVGTAVGHDDGCNEGYDVGSLDGTEVGQDVGIPVGAFVGSDVGALDGTEVG
jgi:hypothetical protein